jgi:large subunit ribosomal protein L25
MSEIVLQAQRRAPGRSNARQLRRGGIVPGVFYFHGEEPIAVAATELALRPLVYTHESHIVRMRLDDGVEKTCVLKDIDFDPITDRPVHFDLLGVSADQEMTTEVPVLVSGHSIGARDGGIIDVVLHRLTIACLPADLPEHIEVDVTDLHINQSIHVSDLKLPNVRVRHADDATIVSCSPPRVAVEPEAVAAVAEPELVAKPKTEE